MVLQSMIQPARLALTVMLTFLALPASAANAPDVPLELTAREPGADTSLLERLQLAQSRSCSPRRVCGEHHSCEDARWSLANCSWGGRLDRDNDGIPCESMC